MYFPPKNYNLIEFIYRKVIIKSVKKYINYFNKNLRCIKPTIFSFFRTQYGDKREIV